MVMKEIDKIINHRRSVRIYDENAPYDTEIVKDCIKRATLAPNSSNMQLWEFYKISNPEIKKKLAEYCMNQSAARTANELVVVVTRKDLWRKRAKFNLDIFKKQMGEFSPQYLDLKLITFQKELEKIISKSSATGECSVCRPRIEKGYQQLTPSE
mgnify:CR=1 FL=1